MISVVVPVHDEERSVALLYEELEAALEPGGEPWEAVFVDDGSQDGTFAALTRLHARTPNTRKPAGLWPRSKPTSPAKWRQPMRSSSPRVSC